MVRNLGEPIAILPIGRVDELRRLPVPLKQDVQRRPLRLRLPTGNVPNQAIGLVPRHEVLGAQINLSRKLLPWPWPATPLGHKAPIALPSRPDPHPKLTQNPVGRQPL